LKLTTDGHEASRGLSATADLASCMYRQLLITSQLSVFIL